MNGSAISTPRSTMGLRRSALGRWIGQRIPGVVLAVFTVTSNGAEPLPPERIVWDQVPLVVQLPIGVERRVSFPETVRLGLPSALESRLRTQSVDGVVYWLASAPFERARVQVQGLGSGRIYLLDLEAPTEGASTAPIEVHLAEAPREPADVARPGTETTDTVAPPHYVALTRFAAQQLYAPERVLADLSVRIPGVTRIPVRIAPINLYRGGGVTATPVAAWAGGDLHVTAIKLVNRTREVVELDPRALRGHWLTATFHHERLHPAGDPADVTAVYLVSARRFEVALGWVGE